MVVAVENDRVGFHELDTPGDMLVPQDEHVDAPSLDEVLELLVVVAATPDEQVGRALAGDVVVVGKVSFDDGGVELVHHADARETVGAEDVADLGDAPQRDGHGADELLDRVVDVLGVVAEHVVNAVVEGLDDLDAVLDDAGADDLAQLVVGEQRVDELGVVGLERGDAGEGAVREIHPVHQPVGVDDLVEQQVVGLWVAVELERLGVVVGVPLEARDVHEPLQVQRVVVKVAGRDQRPGRFDEVNRAASTAGRAVRRSALSEHRDGGLGVLEVNLADGAASCGDGSGPVIRPRRRGSRRRSLRS